MQGGIKVLLDAHVANNDLQSAVACSTASSHEDLHVVTSTSSCADLNSEYEQLEQVSDNQKLSKLCSGAGLTTVDRG